MAAKIWETGWKSESRLGNLRGWQVWLRGLISLNSWNRKVVPCACTLRNNSVLKARLPYVHQVALDCYAGQSATCGTRAQQEDCSGIVSRWRLYHWAISYSCLVRKEITLYLSTKYWILSMIYSSAQNILSPSIRLCEQTDDRLWQGCYWKAQLLIHHDFHRRVYLTPFYVSNLFYLTSTAQYLRSGTRRSLSSFHSPIDMCACMGVRGSVQKLTGGCNKTKLYIITQSLHPGPLENLLLYSSWTNPWLSCQPERRINRTENYLPEPF